VQHGQHASLLDEVVVERMTKRQPGPAQHPEQLRRVELASVNGEVEVLRRAGQAAGDERLRSEHEPLEARVAQLAIEGREELRQSRGRWRRSSP
jgi:predicted secreted protein